MATITPAAVYPDSANLAVGGNIINPGGFYSGTFIPSLWSGKLLEKFYDATVLAAISNTDYEGEIANYGDTVVIRQKPDIGVTPYTAGMDLNYERPEADTKQLLIDKGFYWGTELDDVMEIQADVDMMSMWADDASEQMKIKIDSEVLAHMLGEAYNGVADDGVGANKGITAGRLSQDIDLGVTTDPVAVSSSNVTDLIVDAGTVLDEQNIPENGRWIVIPAWMAGRIKKSELRDASLSGDGTSILRNGRLGMIDRFTIYMSNLLPDSTHPDLLAGEYGVYFGTSIATTFASQVTKVETLRAQTTFGNLMRGLQVYGREVVKNEALGEIIVAKA